MALVKRVVKRKVKGKRFLKRARYRKARYSELLEQGLVIVSFTNRGFIAGRRQYSGYTIIKKSQISQFPNALILRSKPRYLSLLRNIDTGKYILKDRRYV